MSVFKFIFFFFHKKKWFLKIRMKSYLLNVMRFFYLKYICYKKKLKKKTKNFELFRFLLFCVRGLKYKKT
jgi:hypothetical protein